MSGGKQVKPGFYKKPAASETKVLNHVQVPIQKQISRSNQSFGSAWLDLEQKFHLRFCFRLGTQTG